MHSEAAPNWVALQGFHNWKDKPVAASVLTYGPFVIAASLTIASRLLVGLYIHKGIAFRLPSWVS